MDDDEPRAELPEPHYPRPVVAWAIVAALFVAYIFSFIDRMIIGLLVEPIKADMGLSDTQISLLQGMAFALFFTIAGLPIGRLIDRAPRMRNRHIHPHDHMHVIAHHRVTRHFGCKTPR